MMWLAFKVVELTIPAKIRHIVSNKRIGRTVNEVLKNGLVQKLALILHMRLILKNRGQTWNELDEDDLYQRKTNGAALRL